MAREVWFINSGGHRISCNEGSVAFDLMSKDGTFTLVEVDGERQPVSAIEPVQDHDPDAEAEPIADNDAADVSKAGTASAKASRRK